MERFDVWTPQSTPSEHLAWKQPKMDHHQPLFSMFLSQAHKSPLFFGDVSPAVHTVIDRCDGVSGEENVELQGCG